MREAARISVLSVRSMTAAQRGETAETVFRSCLCHFHVGRAHRSSFGSSANFDLLPAKCLNRARRVHQRKVHERPLFVFVIRRPDTRVNGIDIFFLVMIAHFVMIDPNNQWNIV